MRSPLPISQKSFQYDFVISLLASILAIIIALLILPQHFQLAVTFFTGFILFQILERRLEENRVLIWEQQASPWGANIKLAISIILVFLATFIVFLLYYLLFEINEEQVATDYTRYYQNQLKPLFVFNFKILLVGNLICLFYRSKGLLLVIVWNSINWAYSFTKIGQFILSTHKDWISLFKISAVLPHLIFEVMAFILSCLCGIFLSKAIQKYEINSEAFFRVSRACLVIFIVSCGVLFLAAVIEVYFAQNVLRPLL